MLTCSSVFDTFESMKGKELKTAIKVANLAHSGQYRRDGLTPYIEHPKAVASFLGESADEKLLAVAWLHDVLEDSSFTVDDLLSFGIEKDVVQAVQILTKRKGESYLDYLEKVAQNRLSRIVKIADMKSNLADEPTDRQIEKYNKGLKFLKA